MELMGYIILPSFVHLFVCQFIMLSYACHILRTLHAWVLKFYIWLPNEKIADPYFFFLSSMFVKSYASWKKIRIKSCEQGLLVFKLGS